jgi:hypothetical protein
MTAYNDPGRTGRGHRMATQRGPSDTHDPMGDSDFSLGRSTADEPDMHRRPVHRDDPDFLRWRSEQLRALDEDYMTWRDARYKKFAEEFDQWRSRRSEREVDSGVGRPEGDMSVGSLGTPLASADGTDSSSTRAPHDGEAADSTTANRRSLEQRAK